MRVRPFALFLLGAAFALPVRPAAAVDLDKDLVYTPVTPCRIVDTRATGAGAIGAGGTRSFAAIASSNYTAQGGSATDCGTLGLNATAIMVVATAVTPTAPGSATLYAFGTPRPDSASLQFAAGAIAPNTLTVRIPNPRGSSDFTLFSTAQAHFVVDIVGYFAPPRAAALDCTRQFGSFVSVPANTYGFGVSATCPAGYTAMGLGIEAAANVVVADSAINNSGGTVFTYNLGSTAQSTRAWAQCCRVPGR